MALKQLMIQRKIAGQKSQLEEIRTKEADFLLRKKALEKREAECENAISELPETATDEEKAAVEDEIAAVEKDRTVIDAEEQTLMADRTQLEEEIRKLQAELDAIEPPSAPEPKAPEATTRKETKPMSTRAKFFLGLDTDAIHAILARSEVKDFLERTRAFKGQKRAVTGSDLQIPDVFLEILRDNLHRYSKLVSKINIKTVSGKARQTIAGSIPEGIWTEAVGTLNELSISFSQVEVDGYKVGGFIAIPNSTLEDSDINLANEIMDALGQAIGIAVDKAILFGTGVKMPVGIMTRLAQTAKPGYWDTNAPAWTDLHTSHLLKFDPTGMDAATFFANLTTYLGVAKTNYSNGTKWWAMNETTFNKLVAKAIVFNAAGALTASISNTLPIVGGEVIFLNFIADNDIIGGFGSLYLLAERAGSELAVSDQYRFVEDQTVFKGSARYDGTPVIGEGFVAVNIANAAPTTTVTFGNDVANTVANPYALPIAGAYTGAQSVDLYCATPGAQIYYTVDGSTPSASKTLYNGPVAIAATKTLKAIAIKDGLTNSEIFSATYTIS